MKIISEGILQLDLKYIEIKDLKEVIVIVLL